MNKKILLLALLPACPAFAQSTTEHEEIAPVRVPSALTQQIRATELALGQPLLQHESSPVLFSAPEEMRKLKESVDYFSAEDLLEGRIDANLPHEVNTIHFSNATLNLEGIRYEGLDCYQVQDRYSIKAGNELPGDFQYNNTYFLYRDKEGKTLATVIYMTCSIGPLKTEYKLVKKGLSALLGNTLSLAPNPAQRELSITSRITAAGAYSLYISGLEGRRLQTVFDKKQLTEGINTTSVTLNLPAGTYLVILQSEHNTPVTQKLIIK